MQGGGTGGGVRPPPAESEAIKGKMRCVYNAHLAAHLNRFLTLPSVFVYKNMRYTLARVAEPVSDWSDRSGLTEGRSITLLWQRNAKPSTRPDG